MGNLPLEFDFCTLNKSHINSIAHMEEALFKGDNIPEKLLANLMEQNSLGGIVVKYKNKVIAYAIARTNTSEAELLTIAVNEKFRRQNLAEQMLQILLDALKLQNIKSIYLEVRVSNHPAISLYKKMGGEQVGLRKGYYSGKNGNREDAITYKLG